MLPFAKRRDSDYRFAMTPADIKALRTELKCTTRELASAIGVEQDAILSWERGETFPTKQSVDRMAELRQKGPEAIVRRPKKTSAPPSPFAALRDPELWLIVRKLIGHPELLAQVKTLSSGFDDPAP